MSKHIDAKGKNCPIPVVLAKQAIVEEESAFTIEVDNQTAVQNLTRLAASQCFDLTVQERDSAFILSFSKGDGVPTAPPIPTGNYAIFVGRDIIGSGDRELGANLMRMFFYTLASSDDLPCAVLFMNDGVKLTVLDEQVAEHLGTLAAKGVEILVCGTCLNFYGLSESLKIGTVSNMYDILSRMQMACKVIAL